MPSDAMRVWREAAYAYGGQSIEGAEGETYAAAVVERAIADAVAQEGARIERLKSYAAHKDTCEDRGAYPGSCTCGLSRLLKEVGDG